jgi:hypothetical protein
VLVGWRAVRLHEKVQAAVAGLDSGAGFIVADDGSIAGFLADLRRTVRNWGWAVGVSIAIVMVGGFVYGAVAGLISPYPDVVTWSLTGLLALVMVGVGFVVGQLLGHLFGFGQLNRVMKRHRISLAGISTPGARAAMRSLEEVFGFAVLGSMVMCGWFALWWVVWHLGFDPLGYRSIWFYLFVALWLVSFTVFIFAGRWPALSFQRSLDALFGGADMREAIDRQLQAAKAEKLELIKMPEDWRANIELRELERYIDDIEQRRFRSLLLHPYVLNALVVLNVVFFVMPLLFGR